MTTRYEIVVAADDAGSIVGSALPGFEAKPAASGCVRLVGAVPDQAALQGALHRLHDLRVDLVEVRRLDD